jgi:preprotein translocase subunit SecF
MLAGTYSSIFIATPVLCQLKERQPEMKAVAARVEARDKAKATVKADVEALQGAEGDEAVAAAGAKLNADAQAIADEVAAKGGGGRNQPQRKPKSKRG